VALEQRQRQHRLRRARLPEEEAGEQHGAPDQRHGHHGVAPASKRLLDQPEGHARQPEGAEQRAQHVHPGVGVALPSLGHDPQDEDHREDHDRHVDGEDPAPRGRVHELAADQRSEHGADAAPGRPRAYRLAALLRREVGHDDRQRRRGEQRAGHALKRAGRDEDLDRRRQRARDRGDAERPDAEREHAPLPEDVAQRAADQQQRAERDEVGVGGPLLARQPAAEVLLDRGEGHVDHRAVDRDDGGAEDGRDEDEPLPSSSLGGSLHPRR
jgi:hypothetical protein